MGSDGRARAQPPYRRTRGEKVTWRRCSCVDLEALRCGWRPLAWPCHWSRRPNRNRRKTIAYTALAVATRWPPRHRRHPGSHLSRRRARPCCRHMLPNMIFSQPGAWSAEPSGLVPGPCTRCVMSPRLMVPVVEEARKSSRCPTGGGDHTRSSLLMVQMDSAPASTA